MLMKRLETTSRISMKFGPSFEESTSKTSLIFTWNLRAVVSNFQESGDKSENSNYFLSAQNDPFGELFSKIIFKSSSEFLFWQKLGKIEIGLNGPDGPIEIMLISTFSKLSFKTRKRFLELMFSQ